MSIVVAIERFGKHTNINPVKLPTNSFFEVVRYLEYVCGYFGVSPDRVAFRWMPDGSDRSYFVLYPDMNIIGSFRIYDDVGA